MRRAWTVGLLALALGGWPLGGAQTKTFSADTLERQAQQVVASPGFVTVIEFSEKVGLFVTGQGRLLQLRREGQRLFVSAAANSGTTDLVVEVGGRTLLFTVAIKPGTSPRRYVVLGGAPKAAAKPGQPSAPRASGTPSAPTPSIPTASATRPAAGAWSSPGQAPPQQRLALPPARPGAGPATGSADQLVWADFEQQPAGPVVGHAGGAVGLYSYQQDDSRPARIMGRDQVSAVPGVVPAAGGLGQRAYFDYAFPSGDNWAGVGMFIFFGQDADVRRFSAVSLDLSATGTTEVRLSLHQADQTTGLVNTIRVTPTLTRYRIPLSAFGLPDGAEGKERRSPQEVLAALQVVALDVKKNGPDASRGRVVIDNVVFLK